MPTPNGFSNMKMRGPARHQTIQTLGADRAGIPTAQMYLYEKTPVAVNIVSVVKTAEVKQTRKEFPTELLIEFDGAHNAKKYDVMRMMDGVLEGWEFEILKVTDATHVIVHNIGDVEGVEQLPEVGDAVKTLRWTTALSDQSGALQVSQGPLQFIKGGLTVEVIQDEALPANNQPLPAGLYFYKDGVVVPVTDDADPNNVAAIPVMIKAVDGTNITINAGDINVQTSSEGVNFDSMRIGDGSGVFLMITADGEAKVWDEKCENKLGDIEGQLIDILGFLNAEDFASETTLATLATEAKLEAVRLLIASLDGKDFATQTTLNALLTAFNAEDFASEAKLEAVRLLIASLDGKDFATQTTLAALNAKFGTLGQKASAGSAPVVLSTEQEAKIDSLATKLDSLIASNANRTLDSVVNITATTDPVNAPAGAKGFIVQNSTNSGGALRFGKTGSTVNAANGFFLDVGQSTSYINGAGNLKFFDVGGAGLDAAVIWFT